jgi:hypothetical protein
MGKRAQAHVNQQIVDSADILIGAFWTRLGTPTGVAPGGAAEEIQRFIEAQKPVALYFSDSPVVPSKLDKKEYARLEKFKDDLQKRGLTGGYASVEELRSKLTRQLAQIINSFMKSPTYAPPIPFAAAEDSGEKQRFLDWCRAFRGRRAGDEQVFGEIRSAKTPIEMGKYESSIVVHVIPMNAYKVKQPLSLETVYQDQELMACLNSWRHPHGWKKLSDKARFNKDGLVLYKELGLGGLKRAGQYIQIYENGLVEAVDQVVLDRVLHDRILPAHSIEEGLHAIIPGLLRVQEVLKVAPPIVLMVSFFGSIGRAVVSYSTPPSEEDSENRINVDKINVPEVVIESFPVDIDVILKPIFDHIARAGGWPKSPNFSATGLWRPSSAELSEPESDKGSGRPTPRSSGRKPQKARSRRSP